MTTDEGKARDWSALQVRERFESYMYDVFAREIQSWDEATSQDVYAISFFIYDDGDDPRKPQVHLSYNTLSQWKQNCKRGTDRREVKWNFAFWLQDFKMILPGYRVEGTDVAAEMEGEELRSAWLAAEGFDESEDALNGDNTPAMTLAFVGMCVRVARRLHESGVIAGKFGRTIPVIVHELEYYDQIMEQTREANPPGATEEFEDWYKTLDESPMPSLGIGDREAATEVIRGSALSAHAESLKAFLEPSVRIFVSEQAIAETVGSTQLTASYFGGLPMLPEGVAWPTWDKRAYLRHRIEVSERIFERNQQTTEDPKGDLLRVHQERIARLHDELSVGEHPLAFVGQISLREIHAVVQLPGWPKEGILAFFYDPAKSIGHMPLDRGHCRILFFPEDVPLVELDSPVLLGEKGGYPKRALIARSEWTLEKYLFGKDRTAYWKQKEYLELLEKLNADGPDATGPVHRCGGHAQELQELLRMQCQLVSNGIPWAGISSLSKDPRAIELREFDADWELVMQFDSDDRMGGQWWGMARRLYFMARRQDIEQGDFSKCWAILQAD